MSIYPAVIRDVVAALPLYQSTNLIHGLTLGNVGRAQVFAALYLCVFGLLSSWFGSRRLTKLLGH